MERFITFPYARLNVVWLGFGLSLAPELHLTTSIIYTVKVYGVVSLDIMGCRFYLSRKGSVIFSGQRDKQM